MSLCSIGGVVIPIPRLVGNEVALLVFCVAYFARREDKAEAAAFRREDKAEGAAFRREDDCKNGQCNG